MTKLIRCVYCNGRGKDPFDQLSPVAYCLVCKGTGGTEVEEPMQKCQFCGGSGKNPLGARIPCIVCGGKGYFQRESDTPCTSCKGTGRSTDSLPCARCLGKGYESKTK